MGCQLREQGHEVGLLVLVDEIAPEPDIGIGYRAVAVGDDRSTH